MRPVLTWCTILACALSNSLAQANIDLNRYDFDQETPSAEFKNSWEMCCDEPTFLRIAKLCVFKLRSGKLDSDKINTRRLCANAAVLDVLCTGSVQAGNLQANSLKAVELCSNKAHIRELCVDSLTTTSLTLSTNLEICTNYRAYANDVTTHTQTSGQPVFFDTIVDDPNNNLTEAAYTYYTAPKTGYYIVTSAVAITGLSGPVFTGVPVALMQIDVNGISRSHARNAFLSFSKTQESSIAALVMLNAGDEVTIGYSILILDPVLGEIQYPGTITLGGAAAANYFAIHLLSGTCPVPPNNACQIQCAPVTIPCADCTDWCDPFAS